MNLKAENVYTRQAAKEMTRKHFWKLLGMSAVAYGIPYALMMLLPMVLPPIASLAIYDLALIVLMVALTLLSCGLMIGLLRAMIDLCRGNENVTVGSVFHCMHMTFRGFGLSLWVGLKTLLWALPGYALMVAGILMTAGMSNSANAEEAAAIVTLVMLGALVLIFALVIPAAMRYLLSTYILADKPNTGVFDCVRQSKAMMKGHKWQAFKLIIPVYLVCYVVMLVISVAISAAMTLLSMSAATLNILSIAMTIAMLLIIVYYAIRMALCYSIFYLKREAEQKPTEDIAEVVAAE